MVQSLECFCVDRLCSPEPGDLILTYKTGAVTQLTLKAPSSDEPVGTKKMSCQSGQMLTGSKAQFNIWTSGPFLAMFVTTKTFFLGEVRTSSAVFMLSTTGIIRQNMIFS